MNAHGIHCTAQRRTHVDQRRQEVARAELGGSAGRGLAAAETREAAEHDLRARVDGMDRRSRAAEQRGVAHRVRMRAPEGPEVGLVPDLEVLDGLDREARMLAPE